MSDPVPLIGPPSPDNSKLLVPATVTEPFKVIELGTVANPPAESNIEPSLRVRCPFPTGLSPSTPKVARLTVVPAKVLPSKAPAYEFCAVRVRLPFKIKEPNPLTTPWRVRVFGPAPIVTAPPNVTAFPMA